MKFIIYLIINLPLGGAKRTGSLPKTALTTP